jgi:hypothetical protein
VGIDISVAERNELVEALVPLAAAGQILPRRILGGKEGVVIRRESTRSGLGHEPADQFAVEPREPHRLHAVVEKRLPDEREERLHDVVADRLGIAADLDLGVRVHPQGEEVEQVVEVDLPVGLGVG